MTHIHKPPVLFVPGALNGGWIWEDNFMKFFQQEGFEVHALDFPSHGAPFLQRQTLGLEDYRRHLVNKIASFSTPPMLIAHSLGGLISLQAMHSVPIWAIALLSPVPPDGLLRSMASLAQRSPISFVKMAAIVAEARLSKVGSAPVGMFSSTSDADGGIQMANRLHSESMLALTQALWQPLPKATAPVPLHFFGATGDHIIPAHEVRRAAAFYKAPVTIYEGMSHALQVERDWPMIANDILRWVNTLAQ
jgi:pimeloyl-ACP methyl ester carboxylesterase